MEDERLEQHNFKLMQHLDANPCEKLWELDVGANRFACYDTTLPRPQSIADKMSRVSKLLVVIKEVSCSSWALNDLVRISSPEFNIEDFMDSHGFSSHFWVLCLSPDIGEFYYAFYCMNDISGRLREAKLP